MRRIHECHATTLATFLPSLRLRANQIAEPTAAIEGLLLIPTGAKVELVSDSQYVLKGLTWRAVKQLNNRKNT
jgi:ribonuclease HI